MSKPEVCPHCVEGEWFDSMVMDWETCPECNGNYKLVDAPAALTIATTDQAPATN